MTCESTVGSRRLVRLLGHDHGLGLGAETVLEAFHVILTVVVVLIEDADFPVGIFLQQVFCVNAPFALVVRLPAHGPGEVLRVAPLGRAGGREQLRHFLGVHVFVDRRVGRRAEALEDQQHAVALDQLARLLDGFWRAIAVVIGDEIDHAAVDAAFGVDLLEVGRDRLADEPVGRSRPAVGIDIADLDLFVGYPGAVFLLRDGRRRGDREPERHCDQQSIAILHLLPPCCCSR